MGDRGYEGMYSPFPVSAMVRMVCIIVSWCEKEILENVDYGHKYRFMQKGDVRTMVDQLHVLLVSRCD